MKNYIAQVGGFTSPAGKIKDIQVWWNELKSNYQFSGDKFNIFECEKFANGFTVTNYTPVFSEIIS